MRVIGSGSAARSQPPPTIDPGMYGYLAHTVSHIVCEDQGSAANPVIGDIYAARVPYPGKPYTWDSCDIYTGSVALGTTDVWGAAWRCDDWSLLGQSNSPGAAWANTISRWRTLTWPTSITVTGDIMVGWWTVGGLMALLHRLATADGRVINRKAGSELVNAAVYAGPYAGTAPDPLPAYTSLSRCTVFFGLWKA